MFLIKKIQYNSPVVLTYAIASFLILFLGAVTNGESTRLLFCVYKSPVTDPFAYIRIFGHVLGHANFQHYFNNFILILLVGPILEEKYGSKVILIAMTATAIITGLLNIVFSDKALLGASGIVFMLILLSSFVNLKKGMVPLTLLLVIIIFIGQEMVAGVGQQDNISHATHIAGGICGAVLGYFINRNKFLKTDTGEKIDEHIL